MQTSSILTFASSYLQIGVIHSMHIFASLKIPALMKRTTKYIGYLSYQFVHFNMF